MKRSIWAAAVIAASVVTIAVVIIMMMMMPITDPSYTAEPTAQHGGGDGTVMVPHVESPVIPTYISDTNNAFAIDFYKTVSTSKDHTGKNLFFSPTSMYVAFSVLYEGADGNTAAQIQDVFGFEPDAAARYNATAHAMASLNRDDPYATLAIANALWLSDRIPVYESYQDIARQIYFAGIETVNFDKDGVKETVAKINGWASNNTNGKIKKVISDGDVGKGTVMVINNAIYFKGTWVTQFPANDTAESEFWKNGAESVYTDFMNVGGGTFDYAHSNGAQVLKMPYEGDRLSMLVILPEGRDTIGALEESLSADMIQQWRQELRPSEIELVSIPKFNMTTYYDLTEPLQALGITDVFEESSSNLDGITDMPPRVWVTKATQDAFVDVNEEGTEAAAVTTIVVMSDSLPPPKPYFIADHQFLFIIQDDESGAILFMGKLSDPTA